MKDVPLLIVLAPMTWILGGIAHQLTPLEQAVIVLPVTVQPHTTN